jgi:hypothetical protein
VIWGKREEEYFLEEEWTGGIGLIWLWKLVFGRSGVRLRRLIRRRPLRAVSRSYALFDLGNLPPFKGRRAEHRDDQRRFTQAWTINGASPCGPCRVDTPCLVIELLQSSMVVGHCLVMDSLAGRACVVSNPTIALALGGARDRSHAPLPLRSNNFCLHRLDLRWVPLR